MPKNLLHESFVLREKFNKEFAKVINEAFIGCEFTTFYDSSWEKKEFPNKLIKVDGSEISFLHKFDWIAGEDRKEIVNKKVTQGYFPFNEELYFRKGKKVFVVKFKEYMIGKMEIWRVKE